MPTEFVQTILQRVYAASNLLGMTDSYTVASQHHRLPAQRRNLPRHRLRAGAASALTGMMKAIRTRRPCRPLADCKLTLHKLFVMINATDELLERFGRRRARAISLPRRLGGNQLRASPTRSSTATGAGQPQGILNSDCLITVAEASGQTAATVVTQNVLTMWSRMWAPCRQNSVWLIHQDVEPQLQQMTLGTGGGAARHLYAAGRACRAIRTAR